MRWKIYLIFAFVILSIDSFAQSDSSKRKIRIGYYTDASAIYGDFSELNAVLSPLGYPELRNFYGGVSIGVTGRALNKNSYSFIKFNSFQSAPSDPHDNSRTKDVRLRNWELQIGGNFDLVKYPKWLIYPFFGEGIGYGQLTLYDSVVRQSFASSAANLTNPITKTWSSFYLFFNAGMGLERKLRIGMYDFYIGFSGGYRLSFSRFTENNYPTYYATNSAPIRLSGLEWNFKIRVELWRQPIPKKNRSK
jgi:hypothetical protein